jgi:Na+/melibiose symporter-like transporter
MPPPLPLSTKLWYGLGQMAEGLKNEAFTLFLLFYYTQVVGLSGALSGQAILIALLFDAVTDPLAGAISDRLESRWGRRHPFLYAAPLPLAVSFYLVFVPPAGLSQMGLFTWLATFAVLARASMTLFHVPHLALGAELSTDYEERTGIVTLQHVFARIGSGAAGALGLLVFMRPTTGYPEGQLNPAAYPPLALTVAVTMVLLILLSAWRTQWRIPYLAKPDAATAQGRVLATMFTGIWQAFRTRSFRTLFLGTLMTFTAWGVTVSLGLHLGTYFWQATTDQLFLWGLCTGISIFAGLGYWRRQAARLDKKPVFIRGILMFTVFTAGATFSKLLGFWPAKGSPADIPLFILTTGILAHFGIASTMVTGRSMMADVTDEDELLHGRRREGIFFGATSFAAKAFFGIGSQIAGLVVDLVGLEPGARPEEVGPEVVRGLGLSLGLSVLILVGLSIAIFSRYDLTRERHAQVRARLDAGGKPAPAGPGPAP